MSELIVNKVLDGIIAVSSDWSVMLDTFGFRLSPAFICSKLDSTKFKGLEFDIYGKETPQFWKVCIGVYYDLSTLLILTSGDNACPESVSKIVKTCFNKALISLGFQKGDHTNEDLSRKILWGKNPALPYEKSRNIGELFLQNLRKENFLNVEVLLQRLGQSCDFSKLENDYLKIIDNSKLKQLIIHYALDFRKENKALFFSRENLLKYLGRPTTEFSTCLLEGYGNFYYNMKEHKVTDVTLVESKFYSEAFKNINVTYSRIFEEPEIAEKLMDPRPHATGFADSNVKLNLKTFLDNVHKIQKRILDIGSKKRDLTVRFESILSYSPEDMVDRDLLRDTPKLVRKAIPQENVIHCIKEMDIHKLRNHLEHNLMPFLNTLETCISEKIESEHGEAYKFNPQMYLNCLAAEAVTALALYGNVTFRRHYLYPQWLIKLLQIEPRRFRTFKKPESWMFSTVQKLDDSTISLQYQDIDIKQILERVQTNCKLNNAYLEPILSGLNACTEESMTAVANILTEAIIKICCRDMIGKTPKFFAEKPMNYKIKSISRAFKDKYSGNGVSIVTVKSFVKRVFQGEFQPLLFVTWLVGIAEFVFKNKADLIKEAVAGIIEQLLLNECTFLFVKEPSFFKKEVKILGVAPFTNRSAYVGIPEEKLEKVICLYKQLVPAAKWISDVKEVLMASESLEDFLEEVLIAPVSLFSV